MYFNVGFFICYIKNLITINLQNKIASYNIEYIHFVIGM